MKRLLLLGLIAPLVAAVILLGQEEESKRPFRHRQAKIVTGNIPPPPGDPGSLQSGTWISIPESAQSTIFNDTPPNPPFSPPVGGWPSRIDDQWDAQDSPNAFNTIQGSWSGGVCHNNEIYIWGGGHDDGAHNGVFAVNPNTGVWRRVTIPANPVFLNTSVDQTQFNPDGSPVARHTYNLLASNGSFIYASGGSLWKSGKGGGTSPNSWKLTLDANGYGVGGAPMYGWSNIANSPAADTTGNLIYVPASEQLYHFTGSFNLAVYNIATNIWGPRQNGPSNGVGTMIVYAPDVDRFYGVGDNRRWWVQRSALPTSTVNPLAAHPLSLIRYPGGVYYPPENRVIFWDGGPTLSTIRTSDNQWEEITPSGGGDPGAAVDNGTFGRISYCGSPPRLTLINGVGNDVWYVQTSTPGPVCGNGIFEPPDEQCDNDIGNPPLSGDGCSSTCTDETVPPAATPVWPVMDEPPGGSYEAFDTWADGECGAARNTWPVLNVGPGQEFTSTSQIDAQIPDNTGRAVVRIHWQATPYPVLVIKQKKCVEVIGIEDGPPGEKPTVRGINAAWNHPGGPSTVIPGGVIIRNLNVHDVAGGDCIRPADRLTFFALEDSDLRRCSQHAVLSPGTNGRMYYRIMRNYMTQFGSHALYLDHEGRVDVIDNTIETPGWGHAIRSVAYVTVIEGNTVSNVQIDGTAIRKWDASPGGTCNVPPQVNDKCSVGMNPIEAYICTQATVRNNTVIKYQLGQAGGGMNLRSREALGACNVEGKTVDGTMWIPLSGQSATDPVQVARFAHEGFWNIVKADLDANGINSRFAFVSTWEGNTVKYTGGGAIGNPWMLSADSGVPALLPTPSAQMKSQIMQFVQSNPGKTCEELAALSPDPNMTWLFEHVIPEERFSLCTQGQTLTVIPFKHPDNWEERDYIVWGTGNVLEACPNMSLDNCTPATGGFGIDIDNNTKERMFYHAPYPQPPGFGCVPSIDTPEQFMIECHDKAVNIINNGGARIRIQSVE